MERFGPLVYLMRCYVLADIMETKLVYMAQRWGRETNVATDREFGGIGGTNVSYVAQIGKGAS